jgi:predicted nucleic acid-binding protein
MKWFNTPSLDWGLCAFSEAGFLRITTNPKAGSYTVEEATALLAGLAGHSGYRYWPITVGWSELAEPFRDRIFGHQQITDSYLLGLAIKEHGVLVTLDKAIKFLAGERYGKHLLVLE